MPESTTPTIEQLNGNDVDDFQDGNQPDHPDSSDGFGSDPPDASASLVELEENDFPTYFSERDGRLFHSGAYPYPLPVDTPEQERFTFLHNLVHQLIGAHYIGPAAEVLAPQEGSERQRMALDVCTGNGKWVMDMARIFRYVHFRGFDIVPIATRYPPLNVQFELNDVNVTPSRWPNGTFDLINSRFVDMAVLDYARLAQEASRLLRPGGLFMSYEWSRLPAFDPSMQRTPSIHAPASTRFFSAIDTAVSARGVNQIASHVPVFLANVGSFTEINSTRYYVPIGPWPENPDMRGIGIACLRIHERYADSIRPLLVESGWAEIDVDNLVADYLHEINNVRGLVSILYTVHARRI